MFRVIVYYKYRISVRVALDWY